MSIRKGRLTSTALSLAPVTFPTGSVLQFAGTTAPDGWLLCDGSAVSRTSYAALFAAISTSHGTGDGSTTFNVPDYRYQIPRGRGGVADQAVLPAAVNITSNEITVTSHQYGRTGFRVRVSSSGTIIGGLAVNTNYYVIIVNSNTIKLATTRANAIIGTAIDLTSQGTGTHTITQAEGGDFSSRTAINNGNSGDNVGSLQEDSAQLATGQLHNWAQNGLGMLATGVFATGTTRGAGGIASGSLANIAEYNNSNINRTSLETRSANILTNYIIKV
jgi:microcystin-dependent protein